MNFIAQFPRFFYICLLCSLWKCDTVISISVEERSLDQFGHMMKELTKRPVSDFNEYGNYCGKGGSGRVLDQIDRCCKVHDDCYGRISNNECKSKSFWDILFTSVYLNRYAWKMQNGAIICESTNNRCDMVLCQCDKTAAECFKKNLRFYNPARKSSSHLDQFIHAFY
ncbi:acidic phospholipase A2-like [Tubulanus polymorphus]|uniref:acidic phospholipase A2-like n=1 Tax=Tubulanus polymorphus TaxID=672921 RepID=UPI003DA4F75D